MRISCEELAVFIRVYDGVKYEQLIPTIEPLLPGRTPADTAQLEVVLATETTSGLTIVKQWTTPST